MTDFKRDRWGRPLIKQVDGSELAYTRISSYGQVLEDHSGLTNWKLRTVVLGAVQRPDLLQLASAQRAETRKLDQLAQQMLDAAGASAAANSGTAVHEALAAIDTGKMTLDEMPDEFIPYARAWHQLLKDHGLEIVPELVETTLVNDRFLAAGSTDNFVMRSNGQLVAIDKKTGKSIQPRPLAYMVQLALYATGMEYNPETDERIALPNVDLERAYIAHIPAIGGEATLYEVNLTDALELADLAMQVRQAQRLTNKVTPAKPAVSRVDMIRDRMRALIDAGHASALASAWPAGVPTFKTEHTHNTAELDAIHSAIASVEAEHQMPFMPEIDLTLQTAKPSKSKPKPKPAKPDEGDPVDKATIDVLRGKIKSLPQEQQVSIAQWAKEAKEAGQTISLSAQPSARRFEIARLLVALASTADAIATLARFMPVETTVGGTICRLTNTQAADLVRQIEKGDK